MAKKNAVNVSSARYHKLKQVDDGFIDLQFQKPEPKIPWKAIMLALFLFLVGTIMLVFASLMFSGYIKHNESTWALLVLGLLMFIPGFYHVRIAYYAYFRYPGFSFDDIPDFD